MDRRKLNTYEGRYNCIADVCTIIATILIPINTNFVLLFRVMLYLVAIIFSGIGIGLCLAITNRRIKIVFYAILIAISNICLLATLGIYFSS